MRLIAVCVICVAALPGCEKAARNMYQGARQKPDAASPFFADGVSTRPPVAGTIEHSAGTFAETSSGREGVAAVDRSLEASLASAPPHPVDAALLARGRDRFTIYCAPCHGALGRGDGPVVKRGFPTPPSYAIDRLRAAPDRHFYDVMTQGYGAMYSYADRVSPEDRWAIVAHIRELQR
jgi:mono/diheme cytochrome c family protein